VGNRWDIKEGEEGGGWSPSGGGRVGIEGENRGWPVEGGWGGRREGKGIWIGAGREGGERRGAEYEWCRKGKRL